MSKPTSAPTVLGTVSPDLGELTIIIRPSNLALCWYIGTRMQLEAEGVIPPGTKWPDGFNDVKWEAGGVRFWLHRQRPEGAKGPRRAFLDCDNWMLRMDPARSSLDEHITNKAKELALAVYRASPEGRAAWCKSWEMYRDAQGDEKFQSFKALVPGLIPPPRKPRSSKRSVQSQEVRHG